MGTGIPLSDRFRGLDSVKALSLERELGRPSRLDSAWSDQLSACTLQITIDGKSIISGPSDKGTKKNTAATCLHKLFSKKLQVRSGALKSDVYKDGRGKQKPETTAKKPQNDASSLKGKEIKGKTSTSSVGSTEENAKPAGPGAQQPSSREVPKNVRPKDPRLLYGNGSYSMAAKKNANVNVSKVTLEQPAKTVDDSPLKISHQITEKRKGYASNVVKKTQLFGYVAHNVEKQKAVSIGGVSSSKTPSSASGILSKPLKSILKKPDAARDLLGPTSENCPLNQRLDRGNVREENKNVKSSVNGSVQEVMGSAKTTAINDISHNVNVHSLISASSLPLIPKPDTPTKGTDSAKTTAGDSASGARQLVKTDASEVKPPAKKESGPAPIVLKLSIIPSLNDGKLNLKLEEEQVSTSEEKGSPSSQIEPEGSVVLDGGLSHLAKSTTVTVSEKQLQTGSPVTIVLANSPSQNVETDKDPSAIPSNKEIFAGTSEKVHLPQTEQNVSGEAELPASPFQVSDLEKNAGVQEVIKILADSYMDKMSTSEGPVLWPPLQVTKRPSTSISLPVQENTIPNESPPKGNTDHEKTQPDSKLPSQTLIRKEISVQSDVPICAETISTEPQAASTGSRENVILEIVDMDISSSPSPSNLHPIGKDVKKPSIENGSSNETAQGSIVPCDMLEPEQQETNKKEEVYAIGKSTSPLDLHAPRKNDNEISNSREEKVYPIEVIAKSRPTMKEPEGFHQQLDNIMDKSAQEAIGFQTESVETGNLMDQSEKLTTFLTEDTNGPLKTQESVEEAVVDFSKGQNDLPSGTNPVVNQPFPNIGGGHVQDSSLLNETQTSGSEIKPSSNPSINLDNPVDNPPLVQTNQHDSTALELNVNPEGKKNEELRNGDGSPGTPVADEKSSEISQGMNESLANLCKQDGKMSESLENLRKRAEEFATTPKRDVSNPACLEENNNNVDKSVVQFDGLVPRVDGGDVISEDNNQAASKPKDNIIVYLRELSCLSDISSEEEWLYSGQDQNQQPMEPLLVRGTRNQTFDVRNYEGRYWDTRNRIDERSRSRSNSLDNYKRSRSNSLDPDDESPYYRGNRGREDFYERREHLPPQSIQQNEQYDKGGYPGPSRSGNMPEGNRYDDTETAPIATRPFMEMQVPPRLEAEGADLQQMTAVQALRLQINAAVNPAHRTALLLALQALLCPQPGNNIENIGIPAQTPTQGMQPVIPDRQFDPVLDRHASNSPDFGQECDDRIIMDRRTNESDLDRKVEFTVTLNEQETEKLLRKNITKRITDEDDARGRPSPENEMPHIYHGERGHYERDLRERRLPEDGLPPMYVERSGFHGNYEVDSGGPYSGYHDETRSLESYKSSDTKTTEEIDGRDFCSGERDLRQEEMNAQLVQFSGARQMHSPPIREFVKNKKSKRKTKQFHGYPLIKDKSNKTDPIPIPLHISSENAVADDPRRSLSPDVEPGPAILQRLEWMSPAEPSEKPPKSKAKKHKHKKHKKSGKKKMKMTEEDTAKKEQLENLEALDGKNSENPSDSDRPPWHLQEIENIEADPEKRKQRYELTRQCEMKEDNQDPRLKQQIDGFLRQARQESKPAVNEGLETESPVGLESALQHCISQSEETNKADLISKSNEAEVHQKEASKLQERSRSLEDCRSSNSPEKEKMRKENGSPACLDTKKSDIPEDSVRQTCKNEMDNRKAKQTEASSDSPIPIEDREISSSSKTSADTTKEESRNPSLDSTTLSAEKQSLDEIQSPDLEKYEDRQPATKTCTHSAKLTADNIASQTPENPSDLEKGKSTSDKKDSEAVPDQGIESSDPPETVVPKRGYQKRSPESISRHTEKMPCRLSPSPTDESKRQNKGKSRSRSPTKQNYSTDDQNMSSHSVDSRHSSPEMIRKKSSDRERKFREQKRPFTDVDLDKKERKRSPSPKKHRKQRDRSGSDEQHRSKKRHYSESDSDREDSIKPFSKFQKCSRFPTSRGHDWRQNRGYFNRERSRTPFSRFNNRGRGYMIHGNQGKFFGDHRGRGRGWGHVDRGRGGGEYRSRGDFRDGKQFFDRSPSMRHPMNDRKDIDESPRNSMKDLGFVSIVPWDKIFESLNEVKLQLLSLDNAGKKVTKATSTKLVDPLLKARDNIVSALKCIKKDTHKLDSVGKHQMYLHRKKYQMLMADTRIHTEFLIRFLPKEEKDSILSGFVDNATGIPDINTFIEGKVLSALRLNSLKSMILPCKEILIDKMRKMRFEAMGPSRGSRPVNRRFNRNIERIQSNRYENGSESDISPDSTRPDTPTKCLTPEIASCPENGVSTPSSPPEIPVRMAISESRLEKETGKSFHREGLDSSEFKNPPQLVRRLLSSEEQTSFIDICMAKNSSDQVVFDASHECSSTSESRTKDHSSKVNSKDRTDASEQNLNSAIDKRSDLDRKRKRSGPDATVDRDHDQVFVHSGSLRGSKDTGNLSSSASAGQLPHCFKWNKTKKKLHSSGGIETLEKEFHTNLESSHLRSPLSSPDAVQLSEQKNQDPNEPTDQETNHAPVMNSSGTMTFSAVIPPKKSGPFLAKPEYALDYSTRVKRMAFQTQMSTESEMGVLKLLEKEKEKSNKKAKSPGCVQASSSLFSPQSIKKSQQKSLKPRKKFFTLGSPPAKKSLELMGKKTESKSPKLKSVIASVAPSTVKSPSGKPGGPVSVVAKRSGTVYSSCDSTVDSISLPNGDKLP